MMKLKQINGKKQHKNHMSQPTKPVTQVMRLG